MLITRIGTISKFPAEFADEQAKHPHTDHLNRHGFEQTLVDSGGRAAVHGVTKSSTCLSN